MNLLVSVVIAFVSGLLVGTLLAYHEAKKVLEESQQ